MICPVLNALADSIIFAERVVCVCVSYFNIACFLCLSLVTFCVKLDFLVVFSLLIELLGSIKRVHHAFFNLFG